jgi:hypothetical protein
VCRANGEIGYTFPVKAEWYHFACSTKRPPLGDWPGVKASAFVGSGGPFCKAKAGEPIGLFPRQRPRSFGRSNAVSKSGTLEPRAALAAMQYKEILALRMVAEVACTSVDGGALQPVLLHEVACQLKIDEASAESPMYRAVAERCRAG